MVEENFKIGIDIELEQSSLADFQKQIERMLKTATEKAFGNVDLPSISPSAGSVKAAASSASVKGSDFPKAIETIMKTQFKSFDASVSKMAQSIENLSTVIAKNTDAVSKVSPTSASGEPRKSTEKSLSGQEKALAAIGSQLGFLNKIVASGGSRGRSADRERDKVLAKGKRIASQPARLQARAAAAAKKNATLSKKLADVNTEIVATSQEYLAQLKRNTAGLRGGFSASIARDPREATKNRPTVGGTQANQKTQSVNRSQHAREEPSGSLTANKAGRTGDGPTDSPGRARETAKLQAANVSAKTAAPAAKPAKTVVISAPSAPTPPPEAIRPHVDYLAQAKSDISSATSAIDKFVRDVESAAPDLFKGMDIRKALNLPSGKDFAVREGDAPTVRSSSGRERHLTPVIKITGEVVTRLDRISHAFDDTTAVLKRVSEIRRRRPEDARDLLKATVRKRMGDAPLYEGHQSAGSFMKAGEAQMIFQPNEKQASRIMGKSDSGKTDAAKIGEVEAMMFRMARANSAFVKSGLDVVSVLGMTEEAAAGMASSSNWLLAKNKDTGLHEGTISGKVQTRQVQELQAGGAGFVKPARTSFMKGFAKILQGQTPVIQSPYHKEQMEKGNIAPSARNFQTAAMSVKNVPQLHEDQTLITKTAARKMDMMKRSTKLVKDPSEDLMVGSGLQDKQALGVDAAGNKVEMALHGLSAEIIAMTQVTKHGVDMMSITYEEFDPGATGMKMSTMPGNKSMVKVVDDDVPEKLGAPKGTEVLTSIEGMLRRGDLQDVIAMIATSMSEGGKASAQMLFDAITGALKSSPELDLLSATKKVGDQYGIDPNVAMKDTQGPMNDAGIKKALSGKLSWYRIENEGMKGESEGKSRYQEPVTVSAQMQRSETLSYAMAAQERSHELVAKTQLDYHKVLRSMTGETANVTAGLRKMKPEEFKNLPSKTVAPEEMAGTLADPNFMKEAFNMQMPKQGGGFEDFYMPGVGKSLGQRHAYDTEEGMSQANDVTGAFEAFRTAGVEVKAARGELDLQNPAVAQEGAEYLNRQMNKQIEGMSEAPKGEGAAMAKQFISTWMPVVKLMDKAGIKAGISWKKMSDTGVETTEKFRGSASKYVDVGKGDFEKMNRIRDLLTIRGTSEHVPSTQPGVASTAAIGSAGAVHKDISILEAALTKLTTPLRENADHMEGLYQTLEEGRQQLLKQISGQGFGKTDTPSRESLRRVSQTRGSGLAAGSQYGKALEFDVDISSELQFAQKMLQKIGESGQDVGDSLSALERIKSLQISKDVIPRDAILLSKTDYANMKAAVKKDAADMGEDLSDSEVESRMAMGIAGRFPTTGGESNQVVKLLEDKTGNLPEGKLGVPGTFATSTNKDLQTMAGPLKEFRSSLIQTIRDNNGFGTASEEARAKLKELNPVIDALTRSFHKSTTNLDFDGDNMIVHAANSAAAASELMTSVDMLKKFGFSAQNALRTISGNLEGPDRDFTSLEGINEAMPGMLKGRPEELMRSRPVPDDDEAANRDAQGLVGGKLSVGLLSDAFNLFHQAVVGGTKLTGDAFATAKDYLMLNINKSMTKMAGDGTEGPMEVLDAIKKGPEGIKEIERGMDAGGGGVFGEMGEMNNQLREHYADMLPAVDPAEIMKMALKEGVLSEGEGLDAGNFNSVIEGLIDKLDLKGQLHAIVKLIEKNIKEDLTSQGLSSSQIESKMDSMFKSQGGKPAKGVDFRDLTTDAFQLTKKKGSDALKKQTPEDQAKAVLAANFEDIDSSARQIDVDPATPKKLSADLQSWLNDVMGLVGVLDDDMIRSMGQDPAKTGGMYDPGPPGTTPGAGAVMIGETSRLKPLMLAIDSIERMETGEIRRLPEILKMAAAAVAGMQSTVGHEFIHQASKAPNSEANKARGKISDQLMSGEGDIGAARDAILASANELPSIKKQSDVFDELKSTAKFGEQAGDTRIGSDVGGGEFSGMKASDAVAKQGTKYMNMVAEEVMAHLNDPSRWMEIFGTIPEGVKAVLVGMFSKIKAEMSDLYGPLEAGANDLTSRVQALSKEPTPEASSVRAIAQQRQSAHTGIREKGLTSGLLESVLKDARVDYGLTPGATNLETGRLETQRAVALPLENEVGIENTTQGLRARLADIGDSERNAGMGFEPGEMVDQKKLFEADAAVYRKQVEATDEGKGGGKKGGEAAYAKAMQEFQAAELQMYINRARILEKKAAELKDAGHAEGPDFRNVMGALDEAQDLAKQNLMRMKIPKTKGQQGLAIERSTGSLRAEAGYGKDGEPGLQIEPDKKSYEDIVKKAGPRGDATGSKAQKAWMSGMGAELIQIQEGMADGATRTQQWVKIWEMLEQKPKDFEGNLRRVATILNEFTTNMGIAAGFDDPQVEDMAAIAKRAESASRALRGRKERIQTPEDLAEARATVPAVREASYGGSSMADHLKKQRADIEATKNKWQADLDEMTKQGITPMGGRHLDKGTFQQTMPDGTVIKKFNMTAKKGMDGYTVSLKDATKAANGLTGSVRNSLRRVVQWGFATGLVYGTIRAFRSMVTTMTDVETKITALKKVMDTSVTNFDKLQDAGTGFAQEFGVAIGEVLDGMVVYGQQGLKVNKILDRTRATMLAVNVTTLSSVEATEALTAAHKVFGSSVSDSTGFVDAWAAVAARHAITAKDLADSIKRSGAAAEVAGVGFNDFLGIVTAIGAVTRQSGKEVATGTKFMFRAMRRPTAQKELAQTGIKSMDAGGDFVPAMDIMKQLAGRWDGMTRAQQVNMAQAMAGIRHYNAFIVLMNNFDEALLASADAANSQGFALRKNRITMQTFTKQMSVMKESANGLVLALSKGVLPFASSTISGVSSLIQRIAALPAVLLKAGAVAAGMGLVFHKTADFISDSMDAMSTGQVASGAKTGFGGSKMFGKLKGAKDSMGAGFSAAAGGAASAEGLTKIGTAAMYARKAVMSVGRGTVWTATALFNLIPALKGVVAGMRAMSAAAATTIGGAVIAGLVITLGLAYSAYQKANISARDFEKSQEDIMGKSEDAASSLRTQLVDADRLGLSYDKIGQAVARMGDAGGTSAELAEGRFKGAATAAQKYNNIMADINQNIGLSDPASIRGISETGGLLVGIDSSFKSLTQSALDAQNAVTAAFKGGVMQAYAKELTATIGWQDKIVAGLRKMANATGIGGSDRDEENSAMSKFKRSTDELRKITAEREKNSGKGGRQLQGLADLLKVQKRQTEEFEKMQEIAANIKRIFESMPIFGDIGSAMDSMDKGDRDALQASIDTGEFGRGSTLESVLTQFMGRQAGLGGVMDYQNTQSMGLSANSFVERGIQGKSGSEAIFGNKALGTKGIEASKQIAMLSAAAAEELGIGAQTLFSNFNTMTGELMFEYLNIDTGRMESISARKVEEAAAALEGMQGNVADHIVTFAKKEVDDAAEETRRLLNMSYTGALAGVRIPEGGMPDLGPASKAEMSVEQRIMKSLPEDMQRLSEVQKQMNTLAKDYSETLDSDVEGSYANAREGATALKVATMDVLEMATRLQREGFHLSVLGQYEKMQQKLAQTLEQSARAAEDYESAERDKNRYLTATAGVTAGMSPVPQLDLGKSFKELTSLERLDLENPNVGAAVRGVKSKTESRSRDVDTLIEMKKQLRDFQTARDDMGEAGSEMEAAQDERLLTALAAGADAGMLEFMRSANTDAMALLDTADKSFGVQEKMLKELGFIADLSATDPKERQQKFQEKIRTAPFEKLAAAYAKSEGSTNLNKLVDKILGISGAPGEQIAQGSTTEQFNQPMIADLVTLGNALFNREDSGRADEARRSRAAGIDTPGPVVEGLKTLGKDDFFGDEKTARFADTQALQDAINELIKAIMVQSSEGFSRFQEEAGTALYSPQKEKEDRLKDIKEQQKREDAAKDSAAAKGVELSKEMNRKIAAVQGKLDEGNTELEKASQQIRLAQSAKDLAISLEDMVKEFKKAEAAIVIKRKSDLEGPFARVGQPGFKTSFDQRREELKSGSNRPMSLDALRSRGEESKKIDFDEKEAKIQQKQAIETDALKRQQSRAEQIRTKMQDIMSDPNQSQATRSEAASFFETLGDELRDSEQTNKRGDDLFFKGIPSLDQFEGLAAKISKEASDQAADLDKINLTKAFDDSRILTVNEKMLKELERINMTVGSPTDTGEDGESSTSSGQTRVSSTARTAVASSAASSRGGDLRDVRGGAGATVAAFQKYYGDHSENVNGPAGGTTTAGTQTAPIGNHRIVPTAGSAPTSRSQGQFDVMDKEIGAEHERSGPGDINVRSQGKVKPPAGNEAGMAGAAALLISASRSANIEQAAKSVKTFNTVLGEVINTIDAPTIDPDTGEKILNARTQLRTVSPEGRAQGYAAGDSLGSQEFRTTKGADGITRTQAGHVGSYGLPEETRGLGIGPSRTSDAAAELQKLYGAQVLSSNDNPSAGMLDSYKAAEDATGGKLRFGAGTSVQSDLSYLSEEGAFKVDIPEKPPTSPISSALSDEARLGDTSYQNAVNRMNNPLEVDAPNLRHPNQWAGPQEIDSSIKDARWDKGVGAEYQASAAAKQAKRGQAITEIGAEYKSSVAARPKWDGGVGDEMVEAANVKARESAMARLRSGATESRAAKAAAAAADSSPFGPSGGVIGDDAPSDSSRPRQHRQYERGGQVFSDPPLEPSARSGLDAKGRAIDPIADAAQDAAKNAGKPKLRMWEDMLTSSEQGSMGASSYTDEGIDILKTGARANLKTMVKTVGKIFAPLAVAMDSREMIGGALQAEKANTPSEIREAAGRTVGAGLDMAAGGALIGGGLALGGVPGAVLGAGAYGAGKLADKAFGTDDSLSYAGQYYDDMSGGSIGRGLKSTGEALMSPGNSQWAEDYGQSGAGSVMANWEMPGWMRSLGGVGPAPTPRAATTPVVGTNVEQTPVAAGIQQPTALPVASKSDIQSSPGYWESQIDSQLRAGGTNPGSIGPRQVVTNGASSAIDDTGLMSKRFREDIRNPDTAVPETFTPFGQASQYTVPSSTAASTGTAQSIYDSSMSASTKARDGATVTDLTTPSVRDRFDRERSTGLSDAEKNVGIKAALASGARTFSGASDKREGGISTLLGSQLEGGDAFSGPTVDMNAALRRMQQNRADTGSPVQVGGSNNRLQSDIVAEHANAQPTSPARATPEGSEARREVSTAAAEGGGNEALVAAIEALGDKLEAAGEVKVPDDLTTAIASVTTAVAGLATTPLTATIDTTQTIPVTVTNIADIPAGASDGGAAVTTLATAISALEGLTELHKEDITALTETSSSGDIALQNSIVAIQEELKVVPVTVDAQIAAATTSLTTEVATTLADKTAEFDGKIAPIDAKVTAVEGLVATATKSVEDFKAPVEAATQTALAAEIAATAATEAAKTAGTLATAATSSAALAAAEAKLAAEAIVKINETVETNRQTEITNQSATGTKIVDVNNRIKDNTTAAGLALSTAKRAENIAQTANSKPRP